MFLIFVLCSTIGETAALLRTAGKEKWITEREEKVHAKGGLEWNRYPHFKNKELKFSPTVL